MISQNFNNCIFISAVNINNGGPKTILDEYVNVLSFEYPSTNIIVCTNSNYNYNLSNTNISFLRYDYPNYNILFRLFFEYLHLFSISLKLKPRYVISFNDITPCMISKYKLNSLLISNIN